MEIYVKISFFPYFLFLIWFSNMILSDALILPVSQLYTQQVMTSQIRSHRISNTNIVYSYANFEVKIDDKSCLNGGF